MEFRILEHKAGGSSSNAERAAILLLTLGEAGPEGMALRELAVSLGEAKPAVHRTLVAMMRHGFVEQRQGRGSYRLGPAIYALSRREHSAGELVRQWRPVLIGLGQRLGCTTFLIVRAGLDAVVLDMHVGPMPIQLMSTGVGGRLPLGAGPGASAILSAQDEATREQVLVANHDRYPASGVTPELARRMVNEAVVRGYSRSLGDIHPGSGGVGVPIIGRDGSCSAAITASVADPALSAEYLERLALATKEAMASAGWSGVRP